MEFINRTMNIKFLAFRNNLNTNSRNINERNMTRDTYVYTRDIFYTFDRIDRI